MSAVPVVNRGPPPPPPPPGPARVMPGPPPPPPGPVHVMGMPGQGLGPQPQPQMALAPRPPGIALPPAARNVNLTGTQHSFGPMVRVSDIGFERLSPDQAREELSDYRIVRFERMWGDEEDEDYDDDGKIIKVPWTTVTRSEVTGLSRREILTEVRRLNRETLSVGEKKRTMDSNQNRQLERALEDIASADKDPRFYWHLDQIDQDLKKVYKEDQRRAFGRYYTMSKKKVYKRMSLTAYFKRCPRPELDPYALLEERSNERFGLRPQPQPVRMLPAPAPQQAPQPAPQPAARPPGNPAPPPPVAAGRGAGPVPPPGAAQPRPPVPGQPPFMPMPANGGKPPAPQPPKTNNPPKPGGKSGRSHKSSSSTATTSSDSESESDLTPTESSVSSSSQNSRRRRGSHHRRRDDRHGRRSSRSRQHMQVIERRRSRSRSRGRPEHFGMADRAFGRRGLPAPSPPPGGYAMSLEQLEQNAYEAGRNDERSRLADDLDRVALAASRPALPAPPPRDDLRRLARQPSVRFVHPHEATLQLEDEAIDRIEHLERLRREEEARLDDLRWQQQQEEMEDEMRRINDARQTGRNRDWNLRRSDRDRDFMEPMYAAANNPFARNVSRNTVQRRRLSEFY